MSKKYNITVPKIKPNKTELKTFIKERLELDDFWDDFIESELCKKPKKNSRY